MSLQATCGGCRKVYKLPEAFAGKQVRCKQCGTVFIVPRPAAAKAEADPLAGGLDDLLAMERNAQAAPPLAPPPGGARPEPLPLRSPRGAAASGAPALLAAPPPLAGPNPMASLFKVPDEPYVELPGEEQIDRVVPWIPPAIVVLAAVVFIYQVVSYWLDVAEAFKVPKDQVKLAGPFFRLVGKMAGWGLLLAAIPAPLVALGIFLSSKILNIRLPEKIYLKSLAVICLPIAFLIVLRFADSPSASAEPAPFASRGSLTEAIMPWFWPISIAMMVALLWVLVRQKLVPYAVTVALAAACLAGPVLALEYAMNPRSRWRGSSSPAWASRGNPAPAPSQPPPRTAWRSDPQPEPRQPAQPPERRPTVTQTPPSTPPQTPPRRTTPTDAPPPSPRTTTPPPAVVTQQRPPDPAPPPAPEPAGPTRADVERAMEKVGRGIQAFVAAKNGQFPRSLDEVVAAGHLAEADLSPAPRVRLIYSPHPRFRQGMPGAVILLYEAGLHDGQRSLLQADGTVRTVPVNEFGKALAESNNLVWRGAP